MGIHVDMPNTEYHGAEYAYKIMGNLFGVKTLLFDACLIVDFGSSDKLHRNDTGGWIIPVVCWNMDNWLVFEEFSSQLSIIDLVDEVQFLK